MQTAASNILTNKSDDDNKIAIEGIAEPTIVRYFETLNAGEFEATAALFAESGALHPPFESAIAGREAIAAYLEAEAKGMQLAPRQGITQPLEEGELQVEVTGKVQTPLFGVNVSWLFVLNPQQEINAARVKLLASPQELLHLRSSAE